MFGVKNSGIRHFFHCTEKLVDQVIAGTPAGGVRPWICELMHPIDRCGRCFIPYAAGSVEQVNIPCNPALPSETVGNRLAGPLFRVVKLAYPGIIESVGGFFGRLSGIGRKFVYPDNGDTDVGLGKRFDDGLQHRPGAHFTSAGSGG